MRFLQVPSRSLSGLGGRSTGWDGLCLDLSRTVLGHPTALLSVPSQNSQVGGLKKKMRHLSLCFAVQKQLKFFFCSTPASGEVQADAQCLGFGRRSKLTWHTQCLSSLSPLPELSPGVALVVCLWPGIYG